MPKTKPKKRQSSLLGGASRMSRRSMLIVSAFVLVFVGIGTLYIGKSQASGHDCVVRTYGYAPNTYYWCVARLQESLQMINWFDNRVAYPGGVDGLYGGSTLNSVRSFQRNANYENAGLSIDGVTGPHTWRWICVFLGQFEAQSTGTWRHNVIKNDMYNDGCNLDGIY